MKVDWLLVFMPVNMYVVEHQHLLNDEQDAEGLQSCLSGTDALLG